MTTYKSVKYNISGADLTAIPTSAITTGTMADARISASSVTQHAATYDDNKLQSNIALLGFKTAVNGSLAKYNLQDQIIDEYTDATGVDASASTNANLIAGVYNGQAGNDPTGGTSTDTSISGYTTVVCSAATGSLVIDPAGASANVDILVVAGGSAGGGGYGGGGGAGGLIYKATHALTANTYDWVVGAGGTGVTGGVGTSGGDSTWTINGGAVEFTAKGGGGGSASGTAADGGSGGGASYTVGAFGSETQTGQSGDSGTYGFGNDGGNGLNAPYYSPGGGGGAGSVGANSSSSSAGNGGTGKDYSLIMGTAVGDSGWFASGGAGGYSQNNSTAGGTASSGGGTNGATGAGGTSSNAQVNTGGGSGGGGGASGNSGNGGSGIILVRYADGAFTTSNANLTLQSTDTTASTANPDYADMVMLMENTAGTATLNTDIKGYISEDSGVTFTQGTLVDEGTWGTNKKILAFHDLDISAQTGSAMCYKITTHNQSVSKETKIHATSIGWR